MTQRATDFLIWRAGQSVGWDCTAREIASDTGLPLWTVREACQRRGWLKLGTRTDNRDRVGLSRAPIDALMANPNTYWEARA